MNSIEFKTFWLNSLPEEPGVYRFYNTQNKLLYVGKAKNLRKRVSSYFLTEKKESARLRLLVLQTISIEFTVVSSEVDALLLENNFIKKHQPKYNIRLKDDKSYPYLCIKNEPFPRVFTTRKKINDGSTYYGPYTNGKLLGTILQIIKKSYPLRTCNLPMREADIMAFKYKSCLEYQIGNCLAPCEHKQTKEAYEKQIIAIKKLINGEVNDVITELKNEMQLKAIDYAFEEAAKIKSKIDLLTNYQAKSTIINQHIGELEVYAIATEETKSIVNYLQIKNGSIIQSFNQEIEHTTENNTEEILLTAIVEIRNKFASSIKNIITTHQINTHFPTVEILVPKIGEKKRLIDLSYKNAFIKLNSLKIKQTSNEKNFDLLSQIKKDLNLTNLPTHIECFDNSNLQGTNPVSAVVVFKQGKPSKKDYRIMHVKTVEGPNDFASMQEALTRRYKRLINEEQPLPQLVLIDGGKGQLSAAYETLKSLNLIEKIQLIGIAKRLEELYFPNDPTPLHLNKKSITLKVLQQLRDEAHRFGIKNHRNLRSKEALKSELDSIKGLGPKTKEVLIKTFKSTKSIFEQPENELIKVIGKNKTKAIQTYLNERSPIV